MDLSQIATLRRVLETFCARHELEFADRPAIIAARELMKFADEGETDSAVLEQRLEDVMQTYDLRTPPAPRVVASMGTSPARPQ